MGNKPTKYKLYGRKFGHLIVQEYAGQSRWICQCDCGNSCEILTGRLIGGHVKSCGCRGKAKTTTHNLKPYVFENLRRYGNTVIGQSTFDRLGKKAILKELSDNGFKCTIRISVQNEYKTGKFDLDKCNERYIIVEIIR